MLKTHEIVPDFDKKCIQLIQCTQYGFTRREAEILVLSCCDIDVGVIGKLMCLSPKTILNHRENARRKTLFVILMKIATSI